MNEYDQIANVLDDAADLIERDGWFQAYPLREEGGGAHCALTAVSRAAFDAGVDFLAPVKALVSAVPSIDGIEVAAWNNADGRTKQEVLDALRLAAKQQRTLADGAA